MMQLGLGFCAYLTRMTWGHNAVQPMQIMVVSTVAHVAGGALVLAASVVLAIQTRRMIDVHVSQTGSPNAHRKGRHRMSSATQPLAVPRQGIAVTGSRLRHADQGARHHPDRDDCLGRRLFRRRQIRRLVSFPGRCCTRSSASAWSAAALPPSTKSWSATSMR